MIRVAGRWDTLLGVLCPRLCSGVTQQFEGAHACARVEGSELRVELRQFEESEEFKEGEEVEEAKDAAQGQDQSPVDSVYP